MNVTDYQEVWQIDVSGQIYEANFEVMAQWIFEGSLLPEDLVKRGNLRWIEARKVPVLMQFFNAKQNGMPPPVFTTTTAGPANPTAAMEMQTFPAASDGLLNPYQTTIVESNPAQLNAAPTTFGAFPVNGAPPTTVNDPTYTRAAEPNQSVAAPIVVTPITADFCSLHPDEASFFICKTCGNGFCRACPKSYGGNVKICPLCGALCETVKKFTEKLHGAIRYDAAVTRGFGFEDFLNALAYPFKFRSSLIFGAVMFMLFTLGQSSAALGGFALAAAGLLCLMFSNMLTFGVLANTVENFAQGKIDRNFMPSFDDFNLWDDVVHPFFLCVATYLVSFGPLLLFVAGLVYFTWTTFNGNQPVSFEDRITVAQNEIDKKKYSDQYEFDEHGKVKNGQGLTDDEKILDLQKLIQEQRKKEVEAIAGKTPAQQREDMGEMVINFLKLGLAAIGVAFVLVLWGVFYYPAACLVAGYTKSFVATMKISVGWETIRILGWDYFKILAMCFVLSAAVFFISVILGAVLIAFEMPGMGNLPAKAIGALFGFYFSVVYAVVLGFALYKNADKLNLYKG